jgi:virulence factor Mce-like protein
MIKRAPTFGRLMAMVVFSLSCVAIVLYLWLTFGGPVPLRPESYRFEAKVREAATLPVEADVRVAGVNVGKVKRKTLDAGAAATLLEIELKSEYAPIRRDSRLILRQKTLLGETYIELAPGRSGEDLGDGGRLADTHVEPTVELDEVFSAFDEPTRRFFQRWVAEVDDAVAGNRGRDLNDSLGNLAGFTVDGERLFRVLDERRGALRRLVADGGTVLEAINERDGALRGLVQNSSEALEATASRDDALAETVRILPTFLDETRATLRRVERFSGDTRPLVSDLLPAANDLGPTLRDLRDVSPDLRATFRSLDPLIRAGRKGVPALGRTVRGAGPVVEALNPFLDELNPVLSLLGFYQTRISGFLTNGGAALQGDFGGERYAPNTVLFEPRSFQRITERPEFDRGHTYLPPNEFNRIQPLGAYDSPDCSRAIGPRNRYGDVPPNDALTTPSPAKEQARRPPCFTSGPNLYDGTFFPIPKSGKAPVLKQLGPLDGFPPATQDRPQGPR